MNSTRRRARPHCPQRRRLTLEPPLPRRGASHATGQGRTAEVADPEANEEAEAVAEAVSKTEATSEEVSVCVCVYSVGLDIGLGP